MEPAPRALQDMRYITNSAPWRAHRGANFVLTSPHPAGWAGLPERLLPMSPKAEPILLKVDSGRHVHGKSEVFIPHATTVDSAALAAPGARPPAERLLTFLGSCQRAMRGVLLRQFDALPEADTRGEYGYAMG